MSDKNLSFKTRLALNEVFPYPTIREHLNSFDLVNCEHDGWWKYIGHTGGVHINETLGQVGIFESTSMNKGKSGVQLHPMGQWLKGYKGRVWVRYFLIDEDKFATNVDIYQEDDWFIKNTLGSSYPDTKSWAGLYMLIASALDVNIRGRDVFEYDGPIDSIFCTMLHIARLMFCGLTRHVIGAGLEVDRAKRLKQVLAFAKEYEPDDTVEWKAGLRLSELLAYGVSYGNSIRVK